MNSVLISLTLISANFQQLEPLPLRNSDAVTASVKGIYWAVPARVNGVRGSFILSISATRSAITESFAENAKLAARRTRQVPDRQRRIRVDFTPGCARERFLHTPAGGWRFGHGCGSKHEPRIRLGERVSLCMGRNPTYRGRAEVVRRSEVQFGPPAPDRSLWTLSGGSTHGRWQGRESTILSSKAGDMISLGSSDDPVYLGRDASIGRHPIGWLPVRAVPELPSAGLGRSVELRLALGSLLSRFVLIDPSAKAMYVEAPDEMRRDSVLLSLLLNLRLQFTKAGLQVGPFAANEKTRWHQSNLVDATVTSINTIDAQRIRSILRSSRASEADWRELYELRSQDLNLRFELRGATFKEMVYRLRRN